MTLTCRIFLKIIIFFIKIHTARQQCGRRICVYVTDSLQFPVIYLISHYFQSRYLISRDFLLLKENKSTIPLKNVLLHISLFFFKFHEYFLRLSTQFNLDYLFSQCVQCQLYDFKHISHFLYLYTDTLCENDEN